MLFNDIIYYTSVTRTKGCASEALLSLLKKDEYFFKILKGKIHKYTGIACSIQLNSLFHRITLVVES